ncbi:peptidoglycan-binding protein [Corallococcus exercitus]|uniref:peptidoglycan-binding protein n=1 Tax=Corallococcus exercitus TaxID=2316736 RepID=UPI0035D4EFBC
MRLKPDAKAPHPHRLGVGSSGPDVKRLEKKLIQHGLLKGQADDHFDTQTRAAVKQFERKNDFQHVDGVVGGGVWRRLELGAAHEGHVSEQSLAGTRDTFKTVTINVKSNPVMDQAAVVHDVKRAASQGGLIGWNEISPDRYFKAIRDLGPEWGHYMPRDGGLRIPNPISWKKSEWKLQDEGFLRTHEGKKGVSPNRYVTWVKLKNEETGKSIIRMNTHLVSGAWSGNKPHKEWRQDMWNKHMDRLDRLVTHFEKKGLPVIVGGDFNRDSYKVLGNQVKYDNKLNVGTHGHGTLDYLMHTPSGSLKSHGAHVDRGFRSDHDSVSVKYTIKG